MLERFFHDIIFGIIKVFASIVDTIVNLMRGLLGLGNNYAGDVAMESITSEAVMYAFWVVLALGFLTTFIFAIIRIIRNYFNDEKDDGTISKSKAVKNILFSILNMFIMPVFCIVLILGTTATARVIDNATHNSYINDYGVELIFSVVGENDLKQNGKDYCYHGQEGYECSGSVECCGVWVCRTNFIDEMGNTTVEPDKLEQITDMDAVKYVLSDGIYYDCYGHLIEDGNGYDDVFDFVVEDNYFDNWLLPLLGGAVMVVSLAMSIVIIAQRVYYIAFMFIISPFICSTRPFDDGARWRKWCEVFI